MKQNRKDKSIGIRLLSAISAFMLIGTIIYIIVSGVSVFSGMLIVGSILGLGGPAAVTGEGVMDIISSFFTALFEGITEIFVVISDFFASMFGG
ncbi:MAG: hypothetical protein CSA45_05575 [Gammaproteobacteria bacterium]|nr:MAG: hypothetical protein CSA45_05575 [Gammaproteobacteria bacterium]